MIQLNQSHAGYPSGTIIEWDGDVEKKLIELGVAVKSPGPVTANPQREKPPVNPVPPYQGLGHIGAPAHVDAAKNAAKAPPPKKLTVQEQLKNLKDSMQTLKGQLARGSKSDLDNVGKELDKLSASTQEIIDNKEKS